MSKVRVLSDILDANNDLDIARLKSSGVTAGSYGSAANVPVITIDAYGRITAAANTAVAAGTADPTLTLTGDATGSATFTNLGNASLAVTISDDSHNHVIANVDGLQGALDAKAPLASPTFTGTPAAPTAAVATNTTQLATTAFVRAEVTALVASAPGTLDTLNELAAALGDDANHVTTMTTLVGTKLSLSGGAMTGNLNLGDSNKIQLGASQDLQIFHDSLDSWIKDVGTGSLYLIGTHLNLEAVNGNNYIRCLEGSTVKLYYSGTEKLSTTNTGIDVTGTISYDKIRTKQEFTATANQTAFTGPSYKAVDHLDVYLNGVMLASSDYTSTANTNSITLSSGASVNDIVTMIAWA
jgi:hypothetical protein